MTILQANEGEITAMSLVFVKTWFRNATRERRMALCAAAGTSINMLWQWANGAKLASAKKAAAVEAAAISLGEPLRRGDLCETCAQCPYYAEAMAKADVFSDA